MFIDLKQLDDLKVAFLDLGKVMSDTSSYNEEYFSGVFKSVEKLNKMFENAVPVENLAKASQYTDQVSKRADEISKMVDSFYGGQGSHAAITASVDKLSEKFSGLSSKIDNMQRKARLDKAKQGAKKASDSDKKRSPNIVKQEMQAVMGRFTSFWASLRLPVFGAIAAGLVGLAAYGFGESQRIKAQAGEVSDIIISGVGGHVKKLRDKVTGWVSGFQEDLQKSYGIDRSEFQATLKTFAAGGISVDEWSQGMDKSFKKLEDNVATASLGIDKMLNLAGGTTASKMVDYADKYGLATKKSQDVLMQMGSLGDETGVGAFKFTKNVESATESTSKLGFGLAATSSLMAKMQEHFENIKIPKHLSANLVATGMKGLGEALSGASTGWKVLIAEANGFGEGVEGIQKLDEFWLRINKEGDNPEDMMKFIVNTANVLVDKFEGDVAKAKYAMKTGLNLSAQDAFLAFEMRDLYNKGDTKGAVAKSKVFSKGVSESLQSEAEKRSKWELAMNKWMKAMAKIGMNLLALMGNALARLIVYFRSLPAYFSSLFGEDREAKQENLAKQLSAVIDPLDKSMDQNIAGIKKQVGMLKKAGVQGLEAIGESFSNVSNALSFDPYVKATGDREDKREAAGALYENSGFLLNKKGSEAKVDTSGLFKANVASEQLPMGLYEEDRTQWADKVEKDLAADRAKGGSGVPGTWKGGKDPLRIVNLGLDDQNNLRFALRGQCPRCGLAFGKKTAVKPTNKRGSNRIQTNTNFEDPAFLDKLARASTSDETHKLREERGLAPTKLDPKLKGILKDLSSHFGKEIRVYQSLGADKATHGKGQALDIGVADTPNREVFDYLRSKGYGEDQGGLGLYPNSSMVHVDTRDKAAMWVDLSKPRKDHAAVPNPKSWLNKNPEAGSNIPFKSTGISPGKVDEAQLAQEHESDLDVTGSSEME